MLTPDVTPPLGRIERSVQIFFLLALFCVPFSTWLTNVFVGLTYLGFLAGLCVSAPLRQGLRSPPAVLALALLALFLLAGSWAVAPHADVMQAWRKYSRLLILPVGIALHWRDPRLAKVALRTVMGGLAVLAASSYLVKVNLMPTSSLGWWRVGDAKDAFAFKNHITLGILLGWAAMVSLLRATYTQAVRERALWMAAMLCFTVPVIFLNQGRTGYVAIFVGLLVLYLLRAKVTPLRTAGAVTAIVLLFGVFYATSANFQDRTDVLIKELRTDQPNTANGLRMSYMRVALKVVGEHPVLGMGPGAFATAYAPTAQLTWPKGSPLDVGHQPHSEFLLQAVQLGLVGLLLYFTLLGTLLRPALAVRSFNTDAMVLLWAVYVTASSFNSLLWDVTEAYWFLLTASGLYVASVRAHGATRWSAAPCGSTADQAPSISVIVTTYNRPDALEAVVSSLFTQSDRDFEIIITDDGSGPATQECVARLRERSPVPLTHVWQEDIGFRLAMSRNGGIRVARGSYIVILDGDCMVQRDFVAQHRRLAQRGYMVTGSRILLQAGFTARVLADRLDLQALGFPALLRHRLAGHINKVAPLVLKLPDLGRRQRKFSYRRIKGCNLGIWRADLEAINGFDESFTGWGYEDSDAVLRLFNAGIMRKDGAYATEVFHLWHREATRDRASSNQQIVEQRRQAGTVRVEHGLHARALATP